MQLSVILSGVTTLDITLRHRGEYLSFFLAALLILRQQLFEFNPLEIHSDIRYYTIYRSKGS